MAGYTEKQLEAIKYSGGNILVSASAGSGKTHTMIERLKRLIIEEGVKVSQVLAVTFTEAAASDMKEKLKKALSDVINDKIDKSLFTNYNPFIKEKLTEELKEIATADISTMHSFCGRLIRSYFFAVGVAPDFKILDEVEAAVMRDRCIEQTFKEFYDSGESWFLTMVERHAVSRSDGEFKKIVLRAYEFCDAEAYPEQLAEKYKEVYSENSFNVLNEKNKISFNNAVLPLIEKAKFALSVFEKDRLEKGCAFTSTLIADMEWAIEQTDVYKLKQFENYKLELTFERKLCQTAKEQKEKVKELREQFIKLIKKLFLGVGDSREADFEAFMQCREHTQGFVEILKRFKDIYTAEKREENALDFNDLEHFALKILSMDEYREEISCRYKYVFIDEFQDTNGVQDKIVSLISRNNVFMVGDDKQSIYGFRGSSSKFFTEKLIGMEKEGEKVVRLNNNFRSARAVVDFVNAIFCHAMTEETYGQNYSDNAKLIFGGLYPQDAEGRAQLHFMQRSATAPEKQESARVYDLILEKPEIIENETTAVASMIAGVITDELGKTFYDVKEKKFKKVNYGDIAILTRGKNSKYVKDLVTGLVRNDVPIQADVKENVCDFPEIQMIINALKLVDCFNQDFPLACTLKSPIGKVRDEELLEIVRFFEQNGSDQNGSFCDAFNFYLNGGTDAEIKNKLKNFKDYFDKIRLVSDFICAHGVLSKLILDNDLQAYLLPQKQGVAKVDRLNRFVSASVSNGKSYTIKEFLSRIERCPDAFGLSPFASENTVKVMTIHASKGLEFPVVIVCGLERQFNDEDEYEEILFSRDYGFAVKRYDDQKRTKKETLLRTAVRAKMADDLIKEEMRLFYVATTRATYSLHLVFSAKEDKRKEEVIKNANCYVDFIPSYIGATLHDKQQVELCTRSSDVRKVYVISPSDACVQKMKENYSFVYKGEEETCLPLKSSVTSVLKSNQDDDFYTGKVFFDQEEKTDAEKGIIAHKILENFDFYSEKDVYEQTEEMVGFGLISKEEIEKVNLKRLENVLNDKVFSKLKGKTLLRERGFLVNVEAKEIFETKSCENVLLQGVIDLLIIDGDSASVVDYKYSTLTASSLKEKYKKQLTLYSYAVEKVLGKKVVGKTLVNLFTGETIEID